MYTFPVLLIMTTWGYVNADPVNEDALIHAIKKVDRQSVLKQLAEGEISDTDIKNRLLDKAEESIENCLRRLSLAKSWKDGVSWLAGVLGSGAGTIGLLFLITDEFMSENEKRNLLLAAGKTPQEIVAMRKEAQQWKLRYYAAALTCIAGGFYARKKGLNLTFANYYLEEAKLIQALIGEAPLSSQL